MWLAGQARSQRLRTMLEFAEEEIIIPDGPYRGRKFRSSRQPYTRLWFGAIALGLWMRFFATGPTQSGKSLSCYVIPMFYHLFEIGETVICGLPDLEMASDKWREDILPAIEASRYRELLPRRGAGSRGGGKFRAVQFLNGATLRFMSGGGGDKTRAGFTSRVLVMTEVDGMDMSSETSREADKIKQLEARLKAYQSRRRVYGECTVSIESGRTWQEYSNGTQSRIVLRCPHCLHWVTPEREHFSGWKDAENEVDAGESSTFACPDCGKPWSEPERADANQLGKLVHRGQEITPEGDIVGQPPKTDTLGFRWSAINNLFAEPRDIGKEEWAASRAPDEDNAEKEMRQFIWALPYLPPQLDLSGVSIGQVISKADQTQKGSIPEKSICFTVGIDIGKYLSHWTAFSFAADGSPHAVDYGTIEVESASIGTEAAILAALRTFRDEFTSRGWPLASGELKKPDQIFVDSGWQGDKEDIYPVYSFAIESGTIYRPSKGFAATAYHCPPAEKRIFRGEHCHIKRHPVGQRSVQLVEFDADHWKTWFHNRVTTPKGHPGCLTLFTGAQKEHLLYARHVTAEKKVEEYSPKKGKIIRWQYDGKKNHYFDASVLACVAAHCMGVRLEGMTMAREPREFFSLAELQKKQRAKG